MKVQFWLLGGWKNKYVRMALLTVFLLLAGAIVFFSVFWPADKK